MRHVAAGIGPTTARKKSRRTSIRTCVKALGEEDEKKLRDAIDALQLRVEGDLRREVRATSSG